MADDVTLPENLPDLIGFLDNDWMVYIADELQQTTGATRLDDECKWCNGRLWSVDYSVVCELCSAVYDSSTDRLDKIDPWVHFAEHRPRYRYNKERHRCPGGFPNYEWLDSDDVDGSVSDVPPAQFYNPD